MITERSDDPHTNDPHKPFVPERKSAVDAGLELAIQVAHELQEWIENSGGPPPVGGALVRVDWTPYTLSLGIGPFESLWDDQNGAELRAATEEDKERYEEEGLYGQLTFDYMKRVYMEHVRDLMHPVLAEQEKQKEDHDTSS